MKRCGLITDNQLPSLTLEQERLRRVTVGAIGLALDFLQDIQHRLNGLEAEGLMRSPRVIQGHQGPELTIDGRSVVGLCSNNYLGLANHPHLVAAAARGAKDFGFGACAARHVAGTTSAHVDAERAVAAFFEQPRALFFTTGYDANLGAIQALCNPKTLVLSDGLNHASIIDGCRLGRGAVRVFRHGDAGHVEELLRAERAEFATAIVVTESLFSMDGDIAPLPALRAVCDRYDAALVVDESHAIGVMGPSGRGLCAHHAVQPDLMTGTFGKAFGASGAFVTGPEPTIRWIENRARSYVFSTASSPTIPNAASAAVELVRHADAARIRLAEHALRLRLGLRDLGLTVPDGSSHIIPIMLGSATAATDYSRRLLERGVFVHGIRPPTVPVGTSRLRVTPMATHEGRHIDFALNAFRAVHASPSGAR